MSIHDKARELERQILAHSGLEVGKNLLIEDIKINFKGENYIHTLRCGKENKEKLVLLHGYGGSGIFYYQLFAELSKTYDVLCIDLLGMGLTSRPICEFTATEDTVDFFIDSIEEWRKVLELENFIICGHSFGGYIASRYALKYQQNITKLILISPLGFTKKHIVTNKEEIYEGLSFWRRSLYKIKDNFFEKKMTPSELANKYAWLFGFMIKRNLTKRFKVTDEVGELIWEYLRTIYKLPIGSERALHYIINSDVIAYHPIEEYINEIHVPVYTYYGDRDWMDDTGARRTMHMKKTNFKLIYIDDSGHQIMMENPKSFLRHFRNIEIITIC